jgi:hypothetical protein
VRLDRIDGGRHRHGGDSNRDGGCAGSLVRNRLGCVHAIEDGKARQQARQNDDRKSNAAEQLLLQCRVIIGGLIVHRLNVPVSRLPATRFQIAVNRAAEFTPRQRGDQFRFAD